MSASPTASKAPIATHPDRSPRTFYDDGYECKGVAHASPPATAANTRRVGSTWARPNSYHYRQRKQALSEKPVLQINSGVILLSLSLLFSVIPRYSSLSVPLRLRAMQHATAEHARRPPSMMNQKKAALFRAAFCIKNF